VISGAPGGAVSLSRNAAVFVRGGGGVSHGGVVGLAASEISPSGVVAEAFDYLSAASIPVFPNPPAPIILSVVNVMPPAAIVPVHADAPTPAAASAAVFTVSVPAAPEMHLQLCL